MGIIQNALNQTIGTIGIAARLSPGYETRQEIYKTQQAKNRLIEENKKLASEQPDVGNRIQASENLGIPGKISEANKKLAELGAVSPSVAAESVRQANINTQVAKGLAENKLKIVPFSKEDLLKQKQKQAMAKSDSVQVNKKGQKRKFKNYVGRLQTSLGVTVSELPENVQKAIIKQYPKAERKKLMDKMDKEVKK